MEEKSITVSTTVNAPIEKAWAYWTEPDHIKNWNFASDDWHTPAAMNDLQVGGRFSYRMEAKDGSFGFDFGGEYEQVDKHAFIAYTIDDGRKVRVTFDSEGDNTTVTENFEAENMNSLELQQAGWQAILDNFKKYTERN